MLHTLLYVAVTRPLGVLQEFFPFNISRLRDWILVGALDRVPELLPIIRVIRKQVINNHLLRCFTKPLEEREVLELLSAEDLKHFNRLITDVLDKMPIILGDNTNVARAIVKSPGVTFRGEDGNTCAAADEKGPLVSNRVPMHFAKGTNVDGDMGSSNRFGDGEVGRVGDADSSPGGVEGLLLQEAMSELDVGDLGITSRRAILVDGVWVRSLEDVLLLLREVIKNFRGKMEVLGDDRLRGMSCKKN